jgi:hypothetical protein
MTLHHKWPREVKTVYDLLRMLDALGEPLEEQRRLVKDYMFTMQRVAPESIKQELREKELFGVSKDGSSF